jgi:adenosylcobinamide-GDP ribazoletransferase
MWSLLRGFSTAVSYVTCLPLSSLFFKKSEVQDFSGLAKYLPLVGILIGVILLLLAHLLVEPRVSVFLRGAILCVTWLALTNGLHYDGLMDVADGIFSHREPKRILEIMQDSRVGNFGAMVGFSVFILKTAALTSISLFALPTVLILSPFIGRFSEAYAIGAFSYARKEGKGKVWHDTMSFPIDLILSLMPLPVAILLLGVEHWRLMFAVLGSGIVGGFLLAHFLVRKVGGMTGDTYGAVVEISELSALIGALIFG